MRPDWLSLPSELLGHIDDCLLATNDMDCYMDFRAVCTSWRSATEDPKINPSDLRFHPRRWILVDEVFQSDARLMVNTATGRLLCKYLPLLRKYKVTATTPGGFFVLADLEPPHAACVLNPLTGHMIRFMGFEHGSGSKVAHVLEEFSIDGAKLFSYHNSTGFADLPGTGHSNHCFLVKCAGQLLFVIMQQDRFKVISIDTVGDDELEPVESIGNRAIFVGYRRSLSVSAEKFPSIAAICIYYVKSTDSSLEIYKYNLQTEKEERVSEAIDSLNPNTLSFASPPFSIVQLLSSYSTNARECQLSIRRREELEIRDRLYFEYLESQLKIFRSMNEITSS